jgi:hypothetical protein
MDVSVKNEYSRFQRDGAASSAATQRVRETEMRVVNETARRAAALQNGGAAGWD